MRSRASHPAILLSAVLMLALATPASAVDPSDDGGVPVAAQVHVFLRRRFHPLPDAFLQGRDVDRIAADEDVAQHVDAFTDGLTGHHDQRGPSARAQCVLNGSA